MKNIIIIPTYNRAAMLYVTVNQLLRCEETKAATILFALDNRADEESDNLTWKVIESLRRPQDILFSPPLHSFKGNSFNVLMAFGRAAALNPDFIFYVEDDIFVGSDFMRWSLAVHDCGDFFASVAALNTNAMHVIEPVDDPGKFYTSRRDYSALGSCFRLESVRDFLCHAGIAFFSDPVSYCRKKFSSDVGFINPLHAEQDGLIRRVMHSTGRPVAWPYVPRCYHFGWYSYHRPGPPLTGSLDFQINRIYELMDHPEKLHEIGGSLPDVDPCDLAEKPWNELQCKVAYD